MRHSWYGVAMSDHGDVQRALAEVAELQSKLAAAYEAGDAIQAERVMTELAAAERRRNRILQRALAKGGGPSYHAALPVREQVARALALLGRPAPVALIRDVAAARFGDAIAGTRLASLRRDEQRSWRSARESGHHASGRPVYIVPALTYDRMAAVRGVLALSSWPLEVRLVAPASQRVDMLYMVDRLATELAEAGDAAWAPDLRRLLWRLAGTVPGAVDGVDLDRSGLDIDRLRAAVAAELAQIGDADAAERADAARRARAQLDEEQQLFGARLTVVSGTRRTVAS